MDKPSLNLVFDFSLLISFNSNEDRSRDVLVKVLQDCELGKVVLMLIWVTHDHEHARDFSQKFWVILLFTK